jgi:acetyl esterase/lipase
LALNVQLLRYLDYLEFNANQNFTLVSSVPEINEYLSQTNIDDPAIMDLQSCASYCGYLLYLKVSEELQKNSSKYTSNHQWLDAMLNVVPRLFKNQVVLDYWLNNQTRYYIENNGIKNIAESLERFYALCMTKEFKESIKSSYNKELERQKDHLVKSYKTVNGYSLDAHIFIPKELKQDELLPAMIIFHGGSWYEGKPDWEFGYDDKLVNVCIEYRTRYRYNSKIFEEVSDAKSAIRWLRMHAKEFHIDPHKIIATGNSAGAHLALCTAMADTLDEPNENKTVSSKPDALVLNSAGYDATYFFTESQKNAISKISPIHLIKENLPPMLIFHGTKDTDTPYQDAVNFVQKMKEKGNLVRIQPIEGSGHWIWANDKYWQVYGKVRSEFFKEIGID